MAGLLNPPNMGVYNVEQARGRVAERDALPGPAARHRADRRVGAVPVLRADRHHREPAQPARQSSAAEKPTRSQLIGKAMSDKAVGSGKVTAADVAQLRVRRDRASSASTSTATRSRSRACRRGSRTSCRRATRPIRSPASRRSAPSCARACARADAPPPSAADLHGLHRPAGRGVDDDQVDGARMRRIGRRRGLKLNVAAAPPRAAHAATGS